MSKPPPPLWQKFCILSSAHIDLAISQDSQDALVDIYKAMTALERAKQLLESEGES